MVLGVLEWALLLDFCTLRCLFTLSLPYTTGLFWYTTTHHSLPQLTTTVTTGLGALDSCWTIVWLLTCLSLHQGGSCCQSPCIPPSTYTASASSGEPFAYLSVSSAG